MCRWSEAGHDGTYAHAQTRRNYGVLGALAPHREVQEGWPSCGGAWGASAHITR
jgi:hypothetical protein